MSKKSVVLLSGGLDSTTVCALAHSQGREIYALTFDYNQRHRFELESAREVARCYSVREHVILPVNLALFGGSSLTDQTIRVDQDTPINQIGTSIPSSYVPARNTVFLSLALAFAETRGAFEIWIGVNHRDYSGYPDCRPEFIAAFEHLANLATKAGVEGTATFEIKTPLLYLSKGEIIKLGLELGVDYSKTMTCYCPTPDGFACGRCESCQIRLAGFRETGTSDPCRYFS